MFFSGVVKFYKNAIEIYRDKINAEGGIDGHLIEVDFYDDKKDPKETLNAANLIVADGEYLAVIGSQTSGCSLAAAPVLQKAYSGSVVKTKI